MFFLFRPSIRRSFFPSVALFPGDRHHPVWFFSFCLRIFISAAPHPLFLTYDEAPVRFYVYFFAFFFLSLYLYYNHEPHSPTDCTLRQYRDTSLWFRLIFDLPSRPRNTPVCLFFSLFFTCPQRAPSGDGAPFWPPFSPSPSANVFFLFCPPKRAPLFRGGAPFAGSSPFSFSRPRFFFFPFPAPLFFHGPFFFFRGLFFWRFPFFFPSFHAKRFFFFLPGFFFPRLFFAGGPFFGGFSFLGFFLCPP